MTDTDILAAFLKAHPGHVAARVVSAGPPVVMCACGATADAHQGPAGIYFDVLDAGNGACQRTVVPTVVVGRLPTVVVGRLPTVVVLVYVVTHRTRDYGERYVVRRLALRPEANYTEAHPVGVTDTLEDARRYVPAWLKRIPSGDVDDPVIVEFWI